MYVTIVYLYLFIDRLTDSDKLIWSNAVLFKGFILLLENN